MKKTQEKNTVEANKLTGRISLIALWSLLAIGCVTPNNGVVDKMPEGAPKGYIEFYAANEDTLGKSVSVSDTWMDQRGHTTTHGYINGAGRLLLACPPGKSDLLLQIGSTPRSNARSPTDKMMMTLVTNGRQIQVPVREGMVTPVRMTFKEVSRVGTLVNFQWDVQVESPRAPSNSAAPDGNE